MSELRQQPLQGFSGVPRTLEPGAVFCDAQAEQTKRLSGQPLSTTRRTHQVRINLPNDQGRRWTDTPPKLRKKLAPVVFGAAIVGIDLGQLVAAVTELHLIAVELQQVLVMAKDAPLDVARINAVLDRIEALTGDRR